MMIDNALVNAIKEFAIAADQAESQDNPRRADWAQAQADATLKALVTRFYGAMPKTDAWGRLIIPDVIKTEVIDVLMPGAVFPGLVY